METREKIFKEINEEREYQNSRWGTEFDDKNTLNDWNMYIGMYGGYAAEIGKSKEHQRKYMSKVAALAVAALETFDRNDGFAPRHYDKAQ